MVYSSRGLALLLAVCIALITTLFLSLFKSVGSTVLIVAFFISFSVSYLMIFVVLEFLIFREIARIHKLINKLKKKELSGIEKQNASALNPLKSINEEIYSFADLKQTLYYFVQELYGVDTKVRFRPSYFPFTEPSAEMDISCSICKGDGCTMCKGSGWVEILGCGMVDPNVLENCGIDSKKYSGFAFGMGIERITNLKYEIKDLRLFSENDIRFLKQFETEMI